ncbi:hypothetical protein M758_8G051700 [Ceratodon purpureus]|uniref:Uncharacterized protein n=1 Tax=Ceratodon purpureus TaxID=3225 RepID=A0A8T0GVL9_CERPU|nr:hypothetical protein KC19_8G053700 [Ceratodon purpureus]KAG0607747.1 hypothetical protein M758_8G051700 [Ceratodon purpureus]
MIHALNWLRRNHNGTYRTMPQFEDVSMRRTTTTLILNARTLRQTFVLHLEPAKNRYATSFLNLAYTIKHVTKPAQFDRSAHPIQSTKASSRKKTRTRPHTRNLTSFLRKRCRRSCRKF